MKRLGSTERSLQTKDSFVKIEYAETIKSYGEKGYVRKLSPDEVTSPSSSWCSPHLPIVKLDKTTTKVRIVFNGFPKCEGLSLNDTIRAGPKLENEIV